MKQFRDQLKVALTADMSDRAKLIWAYLSLGRGLGKTKIAEAFGWPEEDVVEIMDELLELNLVTKRVGTFHPQPFELPHRERDYGEAATPAALLDRVNEAFDKYNNLRVERGVEPVFKTNDTIKRFKDLLSWLNDMSRTFDEFLDFAAKNTGFIQKSGMKVPTVALITGDWIREAFTQAKAEAPRRDTEHAGKTYSDPEAVRKVLIAGGLARARELSSRTLLYIFDSANNMIVDPRSFPEPPDEIRMETLCVKRAIEGGTLASA